MTTLREAAQQALDALEYYRSGEDHQPTPASDAITKLREALAKPEPDLLAALKSLVEDQRDASLPVLAQAREAIEKAEGVKNDS